MKKNYNEDYVKGMKFLLKKAEEERINIRRVQWIPNVSKLLSEHDMCYRFWYNVWEQKRLYRVPFCNTWYDVLHGEYCLFNWIDTRQGTAYWYFGLYKMLGVIDNDGDVDTMELRNMKL